MTEIIAGKLVFNELSKNSKGGTEQMAERLVRDVDSDVLSKFHITFSRIREDSSGLIKIFYAHDLHNDPEAGKLANPAVLAQFEKVICVSEWQAQMYNLALGIPYHKMLVMTNGIEPFEDYKSRPKDGPIKLIYHTTPHRGLGILVPVFEHLAQFHDDITLDVYSSFGIYGWESRDEPYKELFERIKAHPQMNYHGWKPNSDVREALRESHLFAFPSIWPETSCIAAIEAMCAGCQIVHPNLAALPETTAKLTYSYPYSEDMNEHANIFATALNGAINDIKNSRETFENNTKFVASYANGVYNWSRIANQWSQGLKGLYENGKRQDQSESTSTEG